MSESMALVGLDVHKSQTVAAVLDPATGEVRVERLRGEPERVVPLFLEELDRAVAAVYEAGPTGFVLARVAEQRGLDIQVVAPGSIPRAPGDRVKTDRRDARRLVRLLAAGELRFAFVPSEMDERFRDLVRAIDDVRRDLMRARHRLSKFLLRHGVRFQRESVDAAARALAGVLERAVQDSSHAETIARLRCFRSIDTLSKPTRGRSGQMRRRNDARPPRSPATPPTP